MKIYQVLKRRVLTEQSESQRDVNQSVCVVARKG